GIAEKRTPRLDFSERARDSWLINSCRSPVSRFRVFDWSASVLACKAVLKKQLARCGPVKNRNNTNKGAIREKLRSRRSRRGHFLILLPATSYCLPCLIQQELRRFRIAALQHAI